MARKVPLPPVAQVDGLTAFSSVLDKALNLDAQADPDALPGMHEAQGNPVMLAPRIPEAATMVDKLITNASNAGDRWLANVLKPRKEPLAEAKKSNAKYKAQMQASLTADSWLKGINANDEGQMYATIQALGSGAFTSGIAARRGKIAAKFEKMRPLLVALAGTLDAMPTDTDAQREAKMIAAKRGMQEIGKRLKG